MSVKSRRHTVSPSTAALQQQRKRSDAPAHSAQAAIGGVPSNQALSHVLNGGTPLDPRLRAEMESRFGERFAGVRVHNDADAQRSAAEHEARAYTVGEDIVFGPDRYEPHTSDGKQLLAHELAHVVQQRRGGSPPKLNVDAVHERNAVQAAARIAAGASSVKVNGGTGVGLAREPEDDESKKKRARKRPVEPPTKKPLPGVDPDMDAAVERAFIEAPTNQPAPKNPKPARRRGNRAAKDARKQFSGELRERYAAELSVGKGGQVHHGVEVQALKRYPGVFTVDEINAASGMRGIPPEQGGKRQLHNSKIREVWDRHYRNLDSLIKERGLKPGTKPYRQFVREYLFNARAEMDYLYGQFYSEQRAAAGLKPGEAGTKTQKKATPKKQSAPKESTARKKGAGKRGPTRPVEEAAPKTKAKPKPKPKKPTAKKAPRKGGSKAPMKKATSKPKEPSNRGKKASAKKLGPETNAKTPAETPAAPAARPDARIPEPAAQPAEPVKGRTPEPAKTVTEHAQAAPREMVPPVEGRAPLDLAGSAKGLLSGAGEIAGFLGAIPAVKGIFRDLKEGDVAGAAEKGAELRLSFVPELAPLFFAKGVISNYWGERHEAIESDSFAVGDAIRDFVKESTLIGDIPYGPEVVGGLGSAGTAVVESVGYTVVDIGEGIAEGAEDVYDFLTEPILSEEMLRQLTRDDD
jgi:hypothetical protein